MVNYSCLWSARRQEHGLGGWHKNPQKMIIFLCIPFGGSGIRPWLSIKETLCPPRTNLAALSFAAASCYSIPLVLNVSDAMETVMMLVPASHSLGQQRTPLSAEQCT